MHYGKKTHGTLIYHGKNHVVWLWQYLTSKSLDACIILSDINKT